MDTNNTQNQQNLNWLIQEQSELTTSNTKQYETKPTLKLEENKVYDIEVDFSLPFEKWTDPTTGVVKKIIPVIYNGQKMNFWLNTRNPLYSSIIVRGNNGQRQFKIIRIGQAKATKYNLVS